MPISLGTKFGIRDMVVNKRNNYLLLVVCILREEMAQNQTNMKCNVTWVK